MLSSDSLSSSHPPLALLQRQAPSVLLGLEQLDALTASEWGRHAAQPTRTLKVQARLQAPAHPPASPSPALS
tara:strand:- start:265 stop:480 length:216 start_codon:yes stop_codon:yes gene_type:complete